MSTRNMASHELIHNFAITFMRIFANPQTKEEEVGKKFAEQCANLGFRMDRGKRFKKAYSKDAFLEFEALDRIIDDVDKVDLLGSAIFSHWRYITHKAERGSLLDARQRAWFIIALGRLAAITAPEGENPFLFEGELQEIRLVSSNICFGSTPQPEDEVEQRLTITASGTASLTRYKFGEAGKEHEIIEDQTFQITSDAARTIMEAVGNYFSDEYDASFEADVGSWDLTLVNSAGKTFTMTGALSDDLITAEGGLSDIIRSNLDRNDLFIFDGNPDYVTRIEIAYHRNTKIKPRGTSDEAPAAYVIWDYHEQLVIDRDSETMELVREISPVCKVTNTYVIDGGVSTFLDNINPDAFTVIQGNPPDTIFDPLDIREYTIKCLTKHGDELTVSGTYDKNGLPKGWPGFIDEIEDFMSFYGDGELFDERTYGKARRRECELIFCNVTFEEYGNTYCYLADSDEYHEGDYVVVPTGPSNRDTLARIESIEYRTADDAPYPLEKMKRILHKHNRGDYV